MSLGFRLTRDGTGVQPAKKAVIGALELHARACYKGRMTPALQCCAVSGPFGDPKVADSAATLIACLQRRGIVVCAASEEMPAARHLPARPA